MEVMAKKKDGHILALSVRIKEMEKVLSDKQLLLREGELREENKQKEQKERVKMDDFVSY